MKRTTSNKALTLTEKNAATELERSANKYNEE